MKTILTLLGFLLKILLIGLYVITRGAELVLNAFNNTFKQLLK